MRSSLLDLRDVVERSVSGLTSRSGVFRLGEGEALQREFADESQGQALMQLYSGWASLEGSSVDFWETRARDLEALGAPSDYNAYCQEAALVAFRHATDLAVATKELGGAVTVTHPGPRSCGDLYSLALDNGVGACIYRSFRATVLRYRVGATNLPQLRELVSPWATDEAEHVRFFCELQNWALNQISPQRGRNVKLSQRHAVQALSRELSSLVVSTESESLGSPDLEAYEAIFSALDELLWSPMIDGS